MKAIAINGSPRKGWNTELLLKEALRGAAAAGAETELVQLFDLSFKGCVSCFGCKRRGAEPCRCFQRDALSPILERVLAADVLLLGSPVYFGDVTGQMRNFLERLGFITLSYDSFTKRPFTGRINTAFFFTMNAPEEFFKNGMTPMVQSTLGAISRLGGSLEHFASCDTLQFDDYSSYQAAAIDGAAKRRRREEVFPRELAEAFETGKRLCLA